MFLSSLSKTCSDLGLHEDSEEFSAALSSILSAASHTNTMMWIGKMEDCPLDLSGQGQLLKQGRVEKRKMELRAKIFPMSLTPVSKNNFTVQIKRKSVRV